MAEANHPSKLAEILDKKPRFILVVDDEPMIHSLLRPALKEHGFDMEGVESGFDAIDYLGVRRPDLIILDIDMPEMDGIETCKRIRADARGSKVPILFLTGKKTTDNVKKALAAGGNDFVVKPFEIHTLVQRVRRLLWPHGKHS